MQRLDISYAMSERVITLHLPDMGLTPRDWAHAVFAATTVPPTNQYGQPGAREVAAALWADPILGGRSLPFGPGDAITTQGVRVQCLDVDTRGVDAWGVGTPTFSDPVPVLPPLAGPQLHVSAAVPPPDAVAYAEDHRDRLWTGRGAGHWRCLTDSTGTTFTGSWERVWEAYGPLVPLVPVRVVDAPPR